MKISPMQKMPKPLWSQSMLVQICHTTAYADTLPLVLSFCSGIDADGHILSVRVIRHPEDIAPASTPAEGSLLSRIAGESAHVNGARTAEPAQATASASDSVPVSLLQPFDSLLRRAGVYDLATLRKLVRPGKSKEYVEMLAAEFPEEESLRGLTGKWALRERLEEWLGEKADGRDALEWGNRPATGGSRRR